LKESKTQEGLGYVKGCVAGGRHEKGKKEPQLGSGNLGARKVKVSKDNGAGKLKQGRLLS